MTDIHDAGPEHQCGGPQEACCIPGCPECHHPVTASFDLGADEAKLIAHRCFTGWTNLTAERDRVRAALEDAIEATAIRSRACDSLTAERDALRARADQAENKLAEARAREAEVVLGMLLNLHDPPSEALRRRHQEDEDGWSASLSGVVRIGRKIVPRPAACAHCEGRGCDKCDGNGYDAMNPVTDAEREVWAELGLRMDGGTR